MRPGDLLVTEMEVRFLYSKISSIDDIVRVSIDMGETLLCIALYDRFLSRPMALVVHRTGIGWKPAFYFRTLG